MQGFFDSFERRPEFGDDLRSPSLSDGPHIGEFAWLLRSEQERIVNKVCDEIYAMDVVFEPCEDGVGLHPVLYRREK